jgi:hypothetical protein
MQVYAKAKELLHKELQKMTEKGELSSGSLDVMYKLLSAIKNCCKIEMYEEYGEEGQSHASYRRGYAYDDDYSERRGRDRMGRYTSRDGGYSGNDVGRNGYSMHGRGEAKHEMLEEMRDKMRTASPKDKEVLRMCIEYLEETE